MFIFKAKEYNTANKKRDRREVVTFFIYSIVMFLCGFIALELGDFKFFSTPCVHSRNAEVAVN